MKRDTLSFLSHWQIVYYVVRMTLSFFCSANFVLLSFCTHLAAREREK